MLRPRLTRALTQRLRQVSTGWAQLAADTDVLLEALVALQATDEARDRGAAVRQAAALIERIAAETGTEAPEAGAEVRGRLESLTPAERRVADLVAEGLGNPAIAATLFVSRHTVESHLKHIYTKLGIRSRLTLATLVLKAA